MARISQKRGLDCDRDLQRLESWKGLQTSYCHFIQMELQKEKLWSDVECPSVLYEYALLLLADE